MENQTHTGAALLQPRLVHPRMETPRNEELGMHLDAIHDHCDDAIHKGYCNRNGKKLDAALARIIESAEAARKLLRMNS